MTLELKKFNMRDITFKADENKGPVVVLIGRRDTGKSFLVRDLLYYHQDIPIGTVISGTEAGNGFYKEHVPKLFIHDEYNMSLGTGLNKVKGKVFRIGHLGWFNDLMLAGTLAGVEMGQLRPLARLLELVRAAA